MGKEINAGYVITDRLAVGNAEFVIGHSEKAPAQFVTWKCRNGEKDYFWGHYLADRLAALEDLCNRALDEIHHLKFLQQDQKNEARQNAPPALKKKRDGPER